LLSIALPVRPGWLDAPPLRRDGCSPGAVWGGGWAEARGESDKL